MKHEPPVIPFLFFVAVIITLSSIAVYAGLKCQLIKTATSVVINQPSTQEPATTEPEEVDVMAELEKDPQAVEKFNELMGIFQLVKFVKISENGYVFEIGSQGNTIVNGETSLWRVENNMPLIKLTTGISGDCSDFTWSVENDKIIINQMTSPCEAFANFNHKEIDFYGTELTSLSYSSTGSAISYSNQYSQIEIVPDIKGTPCEQKEYNFTDGENIPKTLFYGIIVNDIPFNLAKPEEVACAPAYGESLAEPGLDTPTIKDGTLSFSLPNGQTATIDTNKLIPDKAAPKKLDKTSVTIK